MMQDTACGTAVVGKIELVIKRPIWGAKRTSRTLSLKMLGLLGVSNL